MRVSRILGVLGLLMILLERLSRWWKMTLNKILKEKKELCKILKEKKDLCKVLDILINRIVIEDEPELKKRIYYGGLILSRTLDNETKLNYTSRLSEVYRYEDIRG